MLAYNSIASFESELGNTNLIEIPNENDNGRIFTKCEWENPTGSIKDRIAYYLISELLKSKHPDEKVKIMEYTGGSLGVSLALISKLLDLQCKIVLSESSAASIIKRIQSYGALTHLVDKEKGFLGVIDEAIALSKKDPSWSFLFQHENKANIKCHFETTGLEVLNQIPVKIDSWVASIGTGGSLIGVYKRLVKEFPNVELYATNPDELAYGDSQAPNCKKKFSGSGGLGYGKKQLFVEENEKHVKQHFRISYEDCLSCMWDFYHQEGLKIGSSSAANLIAAKSISNNKGSDFSTVTIFPSFASPEEWSDVEKHQQLALAEV